MIAEGPIGGVHIQKEYATPKNPVSRVASALYNTNHTNKTQHNGTIVKYYQSDTGRNAICL